MICVGTRSGVWFAKYAKRGLLIFLDSAGQAGKTPVGRPTANKRVNASTI
jgi:hypothetical protein